MHGRYLPKCCFRGASPFQLTQSFCIRKSRQYVIDCDWEQLFGYRLRPRSHCTSNGVGDSKIGDWLIDRRRNDVDDPTIPCFFHPTQQGLSEAMCGERDGRLVNSSSAAFKMGPPFGPPALLIKMWIGPSDSLASTEATVASR